MNVRLASAFLALGIFASAADPISLQGKVQQILPGRKALLLRVSLPFDEHQLVVVSPAPKVLYEGDEFSYWVEKVDDVEYTTVLGAPTVVPGYRLLTAEEVDARQMRGRVRQRERAVMAKAEAARVAEVKLQETLKKRAAIDAKTVEFLQRRVGAGSADAAYDLGLRHEIGKGVDKDPSEARRMMIISAGRGNMDAANWIKTNVLVNLGPGESK